ncbi:hypothetical protein [Shinella zoogloeoides]|uniref:hypothetical protein n=1 Tax=Shinella zoogloeoides TaxID=352475 RepID=UPI00273E8F5F|nr:hypothetical protein [Shinella zoogloeoides]WLR91547.1 hypothetical protein Q9316_13690 [Shinella zoogloeoides]
MNLFAPALTFRQTQPNPPATPEKARLTADWLTRHVFSFEVGPQRHLVTSGMLFEKDGRIGGYQHPNEAGWRIDDDRLFILREDGTPSCIAILMEADDGSREIVGPFLLEEEIHLHYFRPLALRGYLPAVQTFDLFDTLVARYCVDPLAVFDAVEAKARAKGFARLRQSLEADLWRSGDYTLDDVYAKLAEATGWPDGLIERLKMLELAEEWDNLFPIQEMVARVRHDDLIISDMYLPESFLRKIVEEKCGLPGLTIHLSNHGKHHGTIWPKILAGHRILRHYGDNHHSDVAQARKAGIDAEHVTTSAWSMGETVLCSVGLGEFAKAVRKARLSSFSFDKTARQAQLAQFDANIPLLIIAGLILIRRANAAGADTLLMCGRDSNMWVHLLRWMIGLSPRKMAVHYLPSSRDLFLADSPAYAAYVSRLRGARTIIADVSGTGRSPAHFIAGLEAQADTSVFVVLKSNRIDPPMEARAPARDDVLIDSAITIDLERFLFERFNTAVCEDRAIGMEFLGERFNVLREHQPLDAATTILVTKMQEAFALTLKLLQESPITTLPDAPSDEDLREALHTLVQVGIHYLDVAKRLPE